jgi:hypothetical protein
LNADEVYNSQIKETQDAYNTLKAKFSEIVENSDIDEKQKATLRVILSKPTKKMNADELKLYNEYHNKIKNSEIPTKNKKLVNEYLDLHAITVANTLALKQMNEVKAKPKVGFLSAEQNAYKQMAEKDPTLISQGFLTEVNGKYKPTIKFLGEKQKEHRELTKRLVDLKNPQPFLEIRTNLGLRDDIRGGNVQILDKPAMYSLAKGGIFGADVANFSYDRFVEFLNGQIKEDGEKPNTKQVGKQIEYRPKTGELVIYDVAPDGSKTENKKEVIQKYMGNTAIAQTIGMLNQTYNEEYQAVQKASMKIAPLKVKEAYDEHPFNADYNIYKDNAGQVYLKEKLSGKSIKVSDELDFSNSNALKTLYLEIEDNIELNEELKQQIAQQQKLAQKQKK